MFAALSTVTPALGAARGGSRGSTPARTSVRRCAAPAAAASAEVATPAATIRGGALGERARKFAASGVLAAALVRVR